MNRITQLRGAVVSAISALVALPALLLAQQTCPATTGATMPLKYHGGPTVAAITPCDLMTRLYIYSADSMMGREAGSPYALRATAYIEQQVRAMGLQPGGPDNSFFDYMPVTATYVDSSSTLTVGDRTFHVDRDFSVNGAQDKQVSGSVIFGGVDGDSVHHLAPGQAEGKIVVMLPGERSGGFFFRRGRGADAPPDPLAGAVAVLTVEPGIAADRPRYSLHDTVQTEGRAAYAAAHPQDNSGRRRFNFGGGGNGALRASITPTIARALLGKSARAARIGDAGAQASIDVKAKTVASPTRDVIAILPGSDPALRGEYIVIGAHSDHIGFTNSSGGSRPLVKHDSLKAYNEIGLVEGADTRPRPVPTAEQWVRINAIKDSLRRIYPDRPDSINNGADDDGSGSVSVLEIAQAFANAPVKPKRSILFIWQMGEEKGLWGSQWFTNHPTVPRDSIIADLNMDMVGRGAATDITGRAKAADSLPANTPGPELHGGPGYVQLVGARRLSTEFGDIAERVNREQPQPLTFDYSMDANGHPQNIYCRSDHANYARYNIPVIFFTTGGHADYHQLTDEPEYIQYEHMARVDKLVYDIAMTVGNLDHRVVVDGKKFESPFSPCQQ